MIVNIFKNQIRILRALDPRMQMQTAATLLGAMEVAPCHMSSLRSIVGISQASISRNCAALGKIHRKGIPGLGLIETVEDPFNRKRKIVYLTPKGEKYKRLLFDPEAVAELLKKHR
jgi:DNA-binding MarR family transcriptional regulator